MVKIHTFMTPENSCNGCVVKKNIKLYRQASEDPLLAARLGDVLGVSPFFEGDTQGLLKHWQGTVETICSAACQSKVLCSRTGSIREISLDSPV